MTIEILDFSNSWTSPSPVDLEVADKRVLMRVDFNVPMDKEGKITNTQRIASRPEPSTST